jgi:glucokinase
MKFSAGIDLGGTFTKLALADMDGNVLARETTPSMTGASAQDLLANARRILESMCSRANLPYPPTEGCGIGVPGVVDYQSGTVKLSGAFGWTNLPLRDIADGIFNCPVNVDTDVNAGLLADLHFGCAMQSSEVVYVSWGTGVGSALAVSRNIYHSRNGATGNMGHTLASPNSSRSCFCGVRGCLESEIGAKALEEKARELAASGRPTALPAQTHLTPEHIANAAAANDPLALEILSDAVTLLAHTLAASISFLNPDTVIFAGGISNCLPIVRKVFDRELAGATPAFCLDRVTIRPSAFGPFAGGIGAAKLATLRRPG